MEMKYRTTSGAIISRDPMEQSPGHAFLPDPAAERGVGTVESEPLLRKEIERLIREYGADPVEAALAICVVLDGHLGLAEEGYFDDDKTVLVALQEADQADD